MYSGDKNVYQVSLSYFKQIRSYGPQSPFFPLTLICDFDLEAGVMKCICDTPSGNDAYVYQILLNYHEQISRYGRGKRKFMYRLIYLCIWRGIKSSENDKKACKIVLTWCINIPRQRTWCHCTQHFDTFGSFRPWKRVWLKGNHIDQFLFETCGWKRKKYFWNKKNNRALFKVATNLILMWPLVCSLNSANVLSSLPQVLQMYTLMSESSFRCSSRCSESWLWRTNSSPHSEQIRFCGDSPRLNKTLKTTFC